MLTTVPYSFFSLILSLYELGFKASLLACSFFVIDTNFVCFVAEAVIASHLLYNLTFDVFYSVSYSAMNDQIGIDVLVLRVRNTSPNFSCFRNTDYYYSHS